MFNMLEVQGYTTEGTNTFTSSNHFDMKTRRNNYKANTTCW